MKNIITLSAIALTTIAAANLFTATAGAETSSRYATSQKTADAIVNEWLDNAVEAVQEGDKKEFMELYDNNASSEQLDLAWNSYRQYFCGKEKYEADAAALSFTKSEINFSIIYYCNKVDSKNTGKVSSTYDLQSDCALKIIDGKWRASIDDYSDTFYKRMKAAKTKIYGENANNNGFCSPDYQMMYGKAVLAGISGNVKSAVVNKDGSVTMVLGFANGYDKTKTITSVKGTISFGKNKADAKKVIDLSEIKFSDIKVLAGDVRYVKVTVDKNELLNKITNISELGYCNANIKTTFRG